MRVRAQHPYLGGLILRHTNEPAHTLAWAVGAAGERTVAERLDQIRGIRVLHDLAIPGTRANIDHVAVGGDAVWVIDSKKYHGRIDARDVGRFPAHDQRLFVGRRDRTDLVDAMSLQVRVLTRALADPTVPVHAALCFVDAQWPLFSRPTFVRGVWIGWPTALPQLFPRDRAVDAEQTERVARHLAERLRVR